MIRHRSTLAAGFLIVSMVSAGAHGQDEKTKPQVDGRFQSLDALNAAYAAELKALDGRRIGELDQLSTKLSGPERDKTYRELFNVAIARELFSEAAPAAERYRGLKDTVSDVRALALFIILVQRGEQKGHDASLDELRGFLKQNARTDPSASSSETDPILTVGEAYLQRLIRSGRYKAAQEVCDLVRTGDASRIVKEHFEARAARLNLLGKPAPAIGGLDLDKIPIRLANYRGKVVLIEFWATWCPPCVSAVPKLNALEEKYKPQGFEIVGVNVDTLNETSRSPEQLEPALRRFTAQNKVNWAVLINGTGEADFAKAYGVDHIPTNFLIGRDGRIVGFELEGNALEQAIKDALAQDIP